eukprot:8763978-Pyramimonas_sp.AAC.1
MLLQTFHPPTRNLVCKTHAVAIAMHAWRWPVHLYGRADPSMRAQRPASLAPPTRRGVADRWAHPGGHLTASRRLGRARHHGNADD